MTDAAAVDGSAERLDPARFAEVFEQHFDVVFRWARARSGADAAEELASETFVRALARCSEYRPARGPVRAWLFAIALGLARERERRLVRGGRALQRLVAREPRSSQPAHEPADDLPRLALALAGLRPQERDALLLLALGGLTYDEIALALDVPVGTVRSRISRARARLAPQLGDLAPHPGGTR
jgi:RNA polymerase sigma factor (sigma-70 family)